MKKMYFLILLMFFIFLFIDCTKQATVEGKSIPNNSIKIESTEEKKIQEREIKKEAQLLPEFDKNNMESSLKSFYPELELLAHFPCNFSKEYDEEYIVFYNDPSRIYSYSAPLCSDKVVVIFLDNKKSLKLEDLKLVSLGYDKRDLEIILKDSNQYGKWNGYCYLSDSDGDGLDELYFYELSGISFGLVIMKYLNDDFKMVEYIDYMGK